MKRCAGLALLAAHALLAFAQPGTNAQEDDSGRIPLAVLQEEPQTAPAPARTASVFIEGNGEMVVRRALLVPIASPDRRRQVLRALADGRGDWQIGPGFTAKASARVAVAQTDDGGYSRDDQVDLREAAVQRQLNDANVAEIGRVNLRQGAALGFNPTDYFKTFATVDTTTRDPQAQRVDRLGTVMLDGQHVAGQGSLLVALAPRLTDPSSLIDPPPQEHLRLGDTNGETRLLIKGVVPLNDSISPELLAFKDAIGWRFGVNVTQAFGRQTIGFAEYSGGRRKPLFQRALEGGVTRGDLPPSALGVAPAVDAHWQNDLALGGTWTSTNRLSLTVEFDYHQAGFSDTDWERWFALGASGSDGALLAQYVRGYAAASLEPLFRRGLFLRAQWDQAAGYRDLTLNGLVSHSLDDGSSLGQVGMEYRLSEANRIRALALFTTGAGNSLYGSDPARYAILLGYVHYL